jgi:hypothetical protein
MKTILIASAAIFVVSGSLLADTVTSTTGAFSAFQAGFASSTPVWVNNSTPPATPGTPFWNNPSADAGVGGSHDVNVGDLLTDSIGFAGTPSVIGSDTVTEEFTAAGGTDPTAFNFVSSATAYNIGLLFAESSLDTGNAAHGTVFGYYVGDTYTPLFTPTNTNSPAGSLPFDPTTAGNNYGFYATVCYSVNLCETYTTGSGNSGAVNGAAGWNHFAAFELASGSYVVAFEDTTQFGVEGLGDFNDVVVELHAPTTTPEPGSVALMSIGVVFLGLAYFRRKAARC